MFITGVYQGYITSITTLSQKTMVVFALHSTAPVRITFDRAVRIVVCVVAFACAFLCARSMLSNTKLKRATWLRAPKRGRC